MTHILLESPITESPRVVQVRGLFDLPVQAAARSEWDLHLPLDERPWHLGLIVGPSGCGKSTIARRLWPEAYHGPGQSQEWPTSASILDAFPAELPIKELVSLLTAVGFASPPAWLLPFHALSTGQQFRAGLARLLAERPALCVVDEFTSVVDRTVARVGSAALARTVRERGGRFVAVTCHEDVAAWLDPDWVYRPAEDRFEWRSLQRRPDVVLDLVRCRASAWPLFAPHHYLSRGLVAGAVCFLASWEDKPVAFSAWLPFVGPGPPARREHRTVVLPDYQGIGIGGLVTTTVASLWRGLGYRAVSTTTHPALIRSRLRSPHWRLRRAPALAESRERLKGLRHATTRLTAGFEYVGPPLSASLGRKLLEEACA